MTDIDALSAKANDAYVDEEYETALKLYTEAISQATDNAKLYLKRSLTYQKLNKLSEAEADGSRAVQLSPHNPLAYVRHGTMLLKLNRHHDAISVCEKGLSISESNKQLQQLLQECKDTAPAESRAVDTSAAESRAIDTSAAESRAVDTSAAEPQPAETEAAAAEVKDGAEAQPVEAVPMPQPKVKHDFYQTETHVIVTILLRKVNPEDLSMDVTPFTLSVTVRREGGSCYSLELDLAHEVLPQQCTSRVSPAKIELKLRKKEALHWSTLEGEGPAAASANCADVAVTSAESQVHKYPSSRHTSKDWDKMAAEIKDEDEGDPLNGMFQKIYKDASEDTRRAMIKSFTESGGTVLSTNWDEIGAKKTEIKPPDGMEFKKYEM